MLRERAARVTERQSRCAWQRGGVDEYYPATAMINSLSVSSGGQNPALANASTAIGRPSHQVAVITRRPTGYFIAHVEGEMFPSVNGASLGSARASAEGQGPDRAGGGEDGVLQPFGQRLIAPVELRPGSGIAKLISYLD